MSQPIPSASPALAALIERAVARVRHTLPADAPWPEGVEHPLARVALASDFVVDTLARQPALLAHLAQPDPPPLPVPRLDPAQPQEWAAQLRRYRAAASARLVWRDVLGLDEVDATLAGATTLAETCLQCALQALEQQFATRHGQVIAEDGSVQRLVVFGLGKLGGGELNFSSDVDLVYAYPQAGQSDGARPLAAEEYFARLGQQLAKLLDETTADGFSHRVDLRLRPFGSAGRVALSFNGMDQYFQREGRDWERYAWLKARAVAGDIAAGEAWLETLRPFVYRRYLDFTALDGLRDMKAAITAEVARHARLDDIKRGPGGIREIEFLAQSLQLIRGGREASLRERRLLPALQALVDLGQIDPPTGQALAEAYRFLRRVENRLQMLRDAQTHALPQGEPERERIALGLGYAHWQALLEALAPHRTRVAAEFAELLAPRVHATAPDTLADYWRALPEGDAAPLLGIGLHDPGNAHHMLAD
ncbi:glutamine-synthetase adenylyltransferase, partial [Xanthomonas campestris]|nr:glutamine-synthetase adenylyltransferase [Xanthomonas campestris]